MTIPIKDNNVVPLFAVPLCKTKIEPLTNEELNYLTNEIEYGEQLHSVAYNSVNNYILDDPKMANVKKKIMDQLNEFLHGYLDVDNKHEFYITTSWMNRYHQNNYAANHYHSNSLISGVLYLTDCEETADIIFHKDKSNANIFTDTVNIDHKKDFDVRDKRSYLYHQRQMRVSPNKFDMVLFPSMTNHSVDINASPDKVRYTMAFNTFVRGTIGSSTSTLDLK